jgi:hypothetical protein
MSTRKQREAIKALYASWVAEAESKDTVADHPVRSVTYRSTRPPRLEEVLIDALDEITNPMLADALRAAANRAHERQAEAQRQRGRRRVCERCGNEYEASRIDSRYCSTTCRVAAHRDRVAVERVPEAAVPTTAVVTGDEFQTADQMREELFDQIRGLDAGTVTPAQANAVARKANRKLAKVEAALKLGRLR